MYLGIINIIHRTVNRYISVIIRKLKILSYTYFTIEKKHCLQCISVLCTELNTYSSVALCRDGKLNPPICIIS